MFHGNASPVAFSKQGSLCCLQCQHGADLRGASRRRRLPVHSLQRREHIRQLNPRALVIVMSPAAKWWHWGLGWISQTGYELINEILWWYCCDFESDDSIRSEFCTCHDSWAVMACAKFWPDLIVIFHITATHMLTRFGVWAHLLCVRWIPVFCISWTMLC